MIKGSILNIDNPFILHPQTTPDLKSKHTDIIICIAPTDTRKVASGLKVKYKHQIGTVKI